MVRDRQVLCTEVQAMLQHFILAIAEDPSGFSVAVDVRGRVLSVQVKFRNEHDCGRFVGYRGRTIKTARYLLHSVGLFYKVNRVFLDVIDQTGRHSSKSFVDSWEALISEAELSPIEGGT